MTLLLPNPARRFPLACGEDPETLGVRCRRSSALAGVRWPVLQSSANRAGGPDPRRLEEVPELLRRSADLVIDGGELPGDAVDGRRPAPLRDEGELDGSSAAARSSEDELRAALDGQFHFDPETYIEMIGDGRPGLPALQDELRSPAAMARRGSSSSGPERGRPRGGCSSGIRTPRSSESTRARGCSAAARESLPAGRVELRVGRLQDPLPDGPFDLVASALCVHHLDGAEKADLFARVRDSLAPGGRFVLADVVVPVDPAPSRTPLTPGYDKPDSVADQLRWLSDAGFDAASSGRPATSR